MNVNQFFARQFAQPSGLVGKYLIAPWLDHINRVASNAVFHQLSLQPHHHVAEIGFGGGNLLIRIARTLKTGSITGVDPSTTVLTRMQSKIAGLPQRSLIKLRTGTIDRLPLADAEMDLTVSVNTIYFWKSIPDALLEARRVIKPGGHLILGFGDRQHLEKSGYTKHGYHTPSIEEVSSNLMRSGFGQTQVTSVHRDIKGDFIIIKSQHL